jgi:hypothetical protein
VMKLEETALHAAVTGGAHERAAPQVAQPHGALDLGRDVARSGVPPGAQPSAAVLRGSTSRAVSAVRMAASSRSGVPSGSSAHRLESVAMMWNWTLVRARGVTSAGAEPDRALNGQQAEQGRVVRRLRPSRRRTAEAWVRKLAG